MESEVNFYAKLVPELSSIGAPMPATLSLLWGDYKNFGKEVLLLQSMRTKGFNLPTDFDSKEGNKRRTVIHYHYYYDNQ